MQKYTTKNLKKKKVGTILVAAPVIPFMHSLTRFILESGYEILHTPNAVHAIKILNMLPINLILIDYNIPKGEYLGLLQEMRDEFGAGIPPVIYMYDPTKNIVSFSELAALGVRDVLTLPLNADEAKIKIVKLLIGV